MAGKRVIIDGVFLPHDKMHPPIAGRMDGTAYDPSLGIWSDPMPGGPGDGGGGGGQPPQPIHPIWGPPGFNPPGPGMPPGIGGGPIIPPLPDNPPELPPGTPPNSVVKPPPEGGWGYITNDSGALTAVYNPGLGGAGPKRP